MFSLSPFFFWGKPKFICDKNAIEDDLSFTIAVIKKKKFSFQIVGETAGTELQFESESSIW